MKSREQHPHSFGGPKDDPRYKEPPLRISDDVVRYDHRAGNDDYKQAEDLFRLMKPEERAPDRQTRQLVVDNISLTRQTALVQLGHLVIVRGVEWGSATKKRYRND
jgi:catalase